MPPKFKPFATKYKAPEVKEKDEEAEAMAKQDDIDTFEVYYTKHLHQRVKTWEEGVLTYNNTNFKTCLYANKTLNELVDSRYLRIRPDFDEDEEFKLNKMLIRVV